MERSKESFSTLVEIYPLIGNLRGDFLDLWVSEEIDPQLFRWPPPGFHRFLIWRKTRLIDEERIYQLIPEGSSQVTVNVSSWRPNEAVLKYSYGGINLENIVPLESVSKEGWVLSWRGSRPLKSLIRRVFLEPLPYFIWDQDQIEKLPLEEVERTLLIRGLDRAEALGWKMLYVTVSVPEKLLEV